MEEQEFVEEEGGTTLREIIGALIKHLWIVLGVSVLAALVAFLVVKLGINPSNEHYQYSFYVLFPDSASGNYPDGAPFEYRDIISSANLEDTKNSNEAFENINVKSMVQNGAISITRTLEEVKNDVAQSTTTDKPTVTYEYCYTIDIAGSYFDKAETAADFITALAQYPVRYANTVAANANDKAYLEAYNSDYVLKYSELISHLAQQRNYVNNKYDSLVKIFGEDYLVDGHSLGYWRSQASMAFGSDRETQLRNELTLNAYTLKETEENVLVTIKSLQSEIEVNQAIIDELQTQMGNLIDKIKDANLTSAMSLDLEAYNNRIAESTSKIKEAENKIAIYYKSIYYAQDANSGVWSKLTGNALTEAQTQMNAAKTAFNNQLKVVYDSLNQATDTYQSVNAAVYLNESRIVVATSGISSVGEKSALTYAIIALLGVFVVGWIVVFAVEKLKPKAEKEAPALPQESEAKAENAEEKTAEEESKN